MDADYRDILQRRFLGTLPECDADKRVSLAEAIADHIRPGQKIHMAHTNSRPYGLMHELIRQYWQKDPQFEIAMLSFADSCVALFLGGMLKKVVTTLVGDLWPSPSPNPFVNEDWLSGAVEIEHWSILAYAERLLAGALRLPFLVTRSMVGTTMAEDNQAAGTFQEIDDPFGSKDKVGLVAAYRPDISLIHVAACDCAGNAIITAPLGESALGPYAAKDGVILSTDAIVSTDYLRRHNHLVKIPASIVKAVVELPMGSHPRGVTNVGVPELTQYAEDYQYMYEVNQAARRGKEALLEWIDEWILSCETHDAFIEKLGADRVKRLRGKAQANVWFEEILSAATGELGENDRHGELPVGADSFLASEMMLVAAARKQTELVQELKLNNILAGVGAANLSAWLASHKLHDAGHAVQIMAEVGYYGYEPRPGDPYIFNFKNTPTCVMTSDILNILGQMVPNGMNLGSLGAAQVDRLGNFNSTCIPGKLHLLGSGGGNDVATSSKAVVVTAYLGRGKFKERVDYITSPGTNVRCVATDYGIFEKPPGEEELVLTTYYASGPTGFSNVDVAVEKIRSHVGWDLNVSQHLTAMEAPSQEELYILRLYDPFKQFLR
jgi:acyl CoA:acetate/3-ketoacid CoA transferase alpha subunit/acyl CoA:acetate/3-ketoacid CoA transferase beta subunit